MMWSVWGLLRRGERRRWWSGFLVEWRSVEKIERASYSGKQGLK